MSCASASMIDAAQIPLAWAAVPGLLETSLLCLQEAPFHLLVADKCFGFSDTSLYGDFPLTRPEVRCADCLSLHRFVCSSLACASVHNCLRSTVCCLNRLMHVFIVYVRSSCCCVVRACAMNKCECVRPCSYHMAICTAHHSLAAIVLE